MIKKKKKNLEDAPKTSWSSGTFISNLKKSAQIRPTNSLYGMRLTFPEEKKIPRRMHIFIRTILMTFCGKQFALINGVQ